VKGRKNKKPFQNVLMSGNVTGFAERAGRKKEWEKGNGVN